jgi:hypothetical protein
VSQVLGDIDASVNTEWRRRLVKYSPLFEKS